MFLTVLGLGSLILAYTIAKAGRGYGWAALSGFAFVGVYLLDLGRIFPVPPNPMSALLATLEWIGTGLGVTLAAVSLVLMRHTTATSATPSLPKPVMLGLAIAALIIVAFATKSAMGI
ncbi:hypothetical protein [Pannonibacter phragmitetus]|uniref:hypothetical protein n=1 Tax=Pannonibacter phragmitetus TaxID=121719 RepID=UPI003D2EA753